MRTTLTLVGCGLLWTAVGLGAQTPVSYDSLRLRPGDLIRTEIWQEEDLTGDFQVDPSGQVTLPMIGDRQVSDRPWLEVREELVAAYRRELVNPSIRLTPYRRLYVLGEVNQPGLYSVDPSVSLAGAVAVAGGAGSDGDLSRIRVVRAGEVVLDGISGEQALAEVGVLSGDQIFVGRRSWFERNTNFLVTATLSVTSILVTIFAR